MRRPCFRSLIRSCFWGAFALPTAAFTADLDVQVRGADGAPIAGAVVSVHLVGQPTPRPKASGTVMIDQQDIQFHPFVTAVPAGTSVMFMNHDNVRHHVYSFAPAKRFELKLASQQQNQAVTFDKVGIVPLGCNIHDRMIAYVNVVDTPWARTTAANGHAIIRGIPAGGAVVTVWHPYLRAAGNALSHNVVLTDAAQRSESFVAPLRAPPRDPGSNY